MPENVGSLPIGSLLGYHATRAPRRPALSCGGQTLTRIELEARANRRARALAAMGIGQDDVVTIALPNGFAHYETAFALWKLGATPNPISSRLPDAELRTIVELVKPKLVVGCDQERLPGQRVLSVAFEPDPSLSADPLPPRVARYWKAMTSGGSTGRPKVIVDHMAGAWDPRVAMGGLPSEETVLNPGPLYHNSPFVLMNLALCLGNHVVDMAKFDALHALELIEAHRVSYICLVPTMMQRIWRLPEAQRDVVDLSSLKTVLHTAAPCPVWLKERWIEWLGPDRIVEGYAGTERQGGTTINGREWLEHKGSVGRAQPGRHLKILDENRNECPPGVIGEIFFLHDAERGASYHYLGAEPIASDGWESLGDLGYLDADGYLYLADRRTDLIISGGANVYPAEVEAAIDSHPDVASSIVIGLPDEDLGQRVHAIVELRPSAREHVDAQGLLDYLEGRIARYKLPRGIEFVEHALRDDAGKARRSRLRQERIAAAAPGGRARR